MNKKLNIIANLILLATLDVAILYTGNMALESNFNYIPVTIFFTALAMGLFLVRDTYKMVSPDFRAAFNNSSPVSDEYDGDYDDFEDETEDWY